MPYKNDFSGVYCLKTLNSKLIYIGSSSQLNRRKDLHKYAIKKQDKKRSSLIVQAISEGDIYTFEILELCDNFLEREQYWIDFYKNQDVYKLINVFDAERNNSSVPDIFREKMSKIRTEKWKDDNYRSTILQQISKTYFTPERLNKKVHFYNLKGEYKGSFDSAKEAAIRLNLSSVSLASAARGKFRESFKYKDFIFIYAQLRVLNKLDELLEPHQELRAISSQAWEASFKYQEGSTTN